MCKIYLDQINDYHFIYKWYYKQIKLKINNQENYILIYYNKLINIMIPCLNNKIANKVKYKMVMIKCTINY